jgi:hypothetical protein
MSEVDLTPIPPRSNVDANITDPVEVANGSVDAGNSSSVVLGGGATFTGSAVNIVNASSIMVNVYSDVASATDGLKIEQSSDNTNWDHDDVFTIPAATGKNFTINPHSQFLRVRYVNGGAAQTAFRLQTIIKTGEATPSSHRIKDAITSDDDARLVKSIPMTQGNNENEYHVVSSNNPLHTRSVDSNHRVGLNTVFGDQIIGSRIPSLAAQFQYGLQDGESVSNTANGGSITISESRLLIGTSTNVAGSADIESLDTLRYIPGNEAYVFFTAAFVNGGSDADHTMFAGIFDYDGGNGNGFYIGYDGEDFVCGRRRDGVDTKHIVDVSGIYPDGTFNPQLGNIYRISYGYLGYAPIHFEVMSVLGDWLTIYEIQYPNTSVETHIVNTFLPLRAEVENTGSAVDHQIYIGSLQSGVVDGANMDVSARQFVYDEAATTATSGGYNVVALRNKTTFNSKTNRVPFVVTLISASTDGNKSVLWEVYKEPTLTAPSWTDIDTNNSVVEYVSNPTSTDDGTLEVPWSMAKVDSFFQTTDKFAVLIRPGETIMFKASSTNNSVIDFGVRWKELF